MIAALWSLVVLAGTLDDAVAACDAKVIGVPPAERDYACYAPLAREPDVAPVLAHVQGLLEEHPDDGRLWLTLAALQGDHGRESEPALRRAIDALVRGELPQYQIQAQLNLARRLSVKQRHAEAYEVLEQADAVATKLAHPVLSAAVVFERLGELSQHADADLLAEYDRARVVYETLPEGTPYQVHRNGAAVLARADRKLGRDRRAARWSETSANVAEAAGDVVNALHGRRAALRDRFAADYERYDPDAVLRFREQTAQLLVRIREVGNPWAELSASLDLARSVPRQEALPRWNACVELAERLDAQDVLPTCQAGAAIAIAESDPAEAKARAQALVVRAEQRDDVEERIGAYRARGRVALSTGDRELAWSSWDKMLDAFEARPDRAVESRTRTQVRAQGLANYRLVAGELLRQTPDVPRWTRRAFEVMERMRARELLEFSRRASLGGRGRAAARVGLDELTTALEPTTAVLMFQVARDFGADGHPMGGSWLLVVTADETRRYRLPGAAQLDPAASMVADGFGGHAGDVPGRALYETLLERPLADLPAGIRELVIVPDGELHRVPFAALGPSPDAPLLERYEVSHSPSATAWVEARRQSRARRRLLALADPTVPPEAELELSSLPGARAEAKLAVALIGEDSELRVGDDASEQALQTATRFGIVHLAAHAVVDRMQPHRTRVVLAPGQGRDGTVYLDELGSSPVGGALVVLASCHGAAGELLAGEGPLSPARALFAAGAPTVVASLWPVDDADAAAFFAELYAALDGGETVARAVALAQSRRREAGAPASAWAGYVVYGNGGLRLGPSQEMSWWVWVVLAALAGAAWGGWLAGRRTTAERGRRAH